MAPPRRECEDPGPAPPPRTPIKRTAATRRRTVRRGAPPTGARLALEPILAAALAMLDEQGLAGLAMRRLAGRLGVQASALYWHVRDKQELTNLLARGLYERARQAGPAGTAWREWLLEFGAAFHRQLLQHPDAAQLCILAQPVTADVRAATEAIAAPLVAGGLGREQAVCYYASVVSLALGWAMYEQSPGMHGYLRQLLDLRQGFDTSLRALVAGLPAGTVRRRS